MVTRAGETPRLRQMGEPINGKQQVIRRTDKLKEEK
jgi:hypothetical protein